VGVFSSIARTEPDGAFVPRRRSTRIITKRRNSCTASGAVGVVSARTGNAIPPRPKSAVPTASSSSSLLLPQKQQQHQLHQPPPQRRCRDHHPSGTNTTIELYFGRKVKNDGIDDYEGNRALSKVIRERFFEERRQQQQQQQLAGDGTNNSGEEEAEEEKRESQSNASFSAVARKLMRELESHGADDDDDDDGSKNTVKYLFLNGYDPSADDPYDRLLVTELSFDEAVPYVAKIAELQLSKLAKAAVAAEKRAAKAAAAAAAKKKKAAKASAKKAAKASAKKAAADSMKKKKQTDKSRQKEKPTKSEKKNAPASVAASPVNDKTTKKKARHRSSSNLASKAKMKTATKTTTTKISPLAPASEDRFEDGDVACQKLAELGIRIDIPVPPWQQQQKDFDGSSSDLDSGDDLGLATLERHLSGMSLLDDLNSVVRGDDDDDDAREEDDYDLASVTSDQVQKFLAEAGFGASTDSSPPRSATVPSASDADADGPYYYDVDTTTLVPMASLSRSCASSRSGTSSCSFTSLKFSSSLETIPYPMEY